MIGGKSNIFRIKVVIWTLDAVQHQHTKGSRVSDINTPVIETGICQGVIDIQLIISSSHQSVQSHTRSLASSKKDRHNRKYKTSQG